MSFTRECPAFSSWIKNQRVCLAGQTGQWPTELTGSWTANTGCQFIGHHPVS